MTLAKVYIRYKEDLPESEMMFCALTGFQARGVETAPFHGFGDIKEISDFGPEVGIVGYIGDVWEALQQLQIPKPPPLDYPDDLQYMLGRKITKYCLNDIQTRSGIFIKPVRHKLFTGFMMSGSFDDTIRLAPYSPDTEVWVSPIVDFISEYRCYILKKEILGVHYYRGDWSKAPDRKTIENAISAWKSQPVAWTLDVGVISDGRTLLVEVNDGYSIGNYGMKATSYARMIEARWEELVTNRIQ
jgi:hypothetical protein